MIKPHNQFCRRCIVLSAFLQLGVSAAQPVYAADIPGLLIRGHNTDFAGTGPAGSVKTLDRQEICSPQFAVPIGQALGGLEARLAPRLSDLGLPTAPVNLTDAAHQALADYCRGEDDFATDVFAIIYASCRMTMDSGPQFLDIQLPPGQSEGAMLMGDFSNNEFARVMLRRNMAAAEQITGSGWSSEAGNMQPLGAGPEIAGYSTVKYKTSFEGGLGGASPAGETSPMAAIAGMVSVTSQGTAWVSDRPPRMDLVQAFYRNFANEVQPNEGASSLFGGMINSLVSMLEKGLPLKVDQTVESKVMGRVMMKARSVMEVSSLQPIALPGSWCTSSFVPEGVAVTDIDQQISQVTRGGGQPAGTAPTRQATAPSRSGPSSADLYSDNVTQMIQNHLQALGYDPGNTDGQASIQTTIAISQFQAEKGLEVTGEVSPQLAGILSAEVDK